MGNIGRQLALVSEMCIFSIIYSLIRQRIIIVFVLINTEIIC